VFRHDWWPVQSASSATAPAVGSVARPCWGFRLAWWPS
jgi:hypothetical protein